MPATSSTRMSKPRYLSKMEAHDVASYIVWDLRILPATDVIDTHVEPSLLKWHSHEVASNIYQAHCPPRRRHACRSLASGFQRTPVWRGEQYLAGPTTTISTLWSRALRLTTSAMGSRVVS